MCYAGEIVFVVELCHIDNAYWHACIYKTYDIGFPLSVCVRSPSRMIPFSVVSFCANLCSLHLLCLINVLTIRFCPLDYFTRFVLTYKLADNRRSGQARQINQRTISSVWVWQERITNASILEHADTTSVEAHTARPSLK